MDELHWKRFIILAVASLAMVGMSIAGLSAMNDAMRDAVQVKQSSKPSSQSTPKENW